MEAKYGPPNACLNFEQALKGTAQKCIFLERHGKTALSVHVLPGQQFLMGACEVCRGEERKRKRAENGSLNGFIFASLILGPFNSMCLLPFSLPPSLSFSLHLQLI